MLDGAAVAFRGGYRLDYVDDQPEGVDGLEEVKVFIMPRRVEGPEGVTTALRQRMNELGVGVHRLKAASGVNHQTLANLANGAGGVELRKARRIADALEVPVGSLFLHKDGAELVEAS